MRRTFSVGAAMLALVSGLGPAAPAHLAARELAVIKVDERKPTVGTSPSAGPAPAVGAPILEDPLGGPGVLWAEGCPTGRGAREFVGDGMIFKVTGPCFEGVDRALVLQQVPRLRVADGEIRLEAREVSGVERAGLNLWFQDGDADEDAPTYGLWVEPAVGAAELFRLAGGQAELLAARADLGGLLAPDDWNTVAVRLQGPKIWLLLNDQEALSAVDETLDAGPVSVGVYRDGDLEDAPESAMVLRNLRVSRLAEGDDARAPAYLLPPEPGEIVLVDPLIARGAVRASACPSGRASTEFTAEGFLMKVSGRCRDTSTSASIGSYVAGVTLPDGEARAEVRIGSSPARGLFRIHARVDASGEVGYLVKLAPGLGWAELYHYSGEQSTLLAYRVDLARLLRPGDWNAVALRLRGTDVWLLLNDEPVLYAVGPAAEPGRVSLEFIRLGNPDDREEATATVRNLRVSALVSSP